ncbi:hypothetical protein Trisim1_007969 [Trichoderma cf. simile WF8]
MQTGLVQSSRVLRRVPAEFTVLTAGAEKAGPPGPIQQTALLRLLASWHQLSDLLASSRSFPTAEPANPSGPAFQDETALTAPLDFAPRTQRHGGHLMGWRPLIRVWRP